MNIDHAEIHTIRLKQLKDYREPFALKFMG